MQKRLEERQREAHAAMVALRQAQVRYHSALASHFQASLNQMFGLSNLPAKTLHDHDRKRLDQELHDAEQRYAAAERSLSRDDHETYDDLIREQESVYRQIT